MIHRFLSYRIACQYFQTLTHTHTHELILRTRTNSEIANCIEHFALRFLKLLLRAHVFAAFMNGGIVASVNSRLEFTIRFLERGPRTREHRKYGHAGANSDARMFSSTVTCCRKCSLVALLKRPKVFRSLSIRYASPRLGDSNGF